MLEWQRTAESDVSASMLNYVAEMDAGAKRFLDLYLKPSSSDYILLLYTADARDVAAHLIANLRLKHIDYHAIPMRPITDGGLAARLVHWLHAVALDRNRIPTIVSLEQNTCSHEGIISELAVELYRVLNKRANIVRVVAACDEMLRFATRVSPDKLRIANEDLFNLIKSCSRHDITSSNGTSLSVVLGSTNTPRCISGWGCQGDSESQVIPAGYLSCRPSAIEGLLVADGVIGSNVLTKYDPRLRQHPVRAVICDGELASFECDNPEIESLIACILSQGSKEVEAIVFGTNAGLVEYIPLMSPMNECRPGCTIRVGSGGVPDQFRGPWFSLSFENYNIKPRQERSTQKDQKRELISMISSHDPVLLRNDRYKLTERNEITPLG